MQQSDPMRRDEDEEKRKNYDVKTVWYRVKRRFVKESNCLTFATELNRIWFFLSVVPVFDVKNTGFAAHVQANKMRLFGSFLCSVFSSTTSKQTLSSLNIEQAIKIESITSP